MSQQWKCNRCHKRFGSAKGAEMHVRDKHQGNGKAVLVDHKAREEAAREESYASRAVAEELDRAMGIPNPDIDWLLP